MTGTVASRKMLIKNEKVIMELIDIAFRGNEQKSLNKDAIFSLINLCTDERDAFTIMESNVDLANRLIDSILDETCSYADTLCAILSNLSRGKRNCELLFEKYFLDANNNNASLKSERFQKLLEAFSVEGFNKTNNLNYLGPFICNLTQLESVQRLILDDVSLMQRLLPYTTYTKSDIRRGGILGAIKNCCFNYDYHERLLLNPEIDVLSRLLLPLAGPEEFDTDEMDKLPEDLQYLPPDKKREEDADIRLMLMETIYLLCSHKVCRDYIISKNAYVILRELHKWEKDERAMNFLEKLVQLLIMDEPERGMENLHQVVIPEELKNKFYEYDDKELEKNFVDVD
jgi:hypothetical protein